jgi:hypothetical protein
MPWFKVDDGLSDHPKVLMAGNAAMGLWVRAGAWSMKHLTDGFVPDAVVQLLGTAKEARTLVSAGLWLKADGGFRFHEWEGRQPSREAVQRDRDAAAERQKRARDRARESRRDDAVTDAVSNGPPVPYRPDPTQIDDGDTHKPGTKVDARDEDPVLEGFQSLGITSPAARGRVLAAVRNALPFGVVSDAEVVDVARALLSASTTHVRFPASYVERACESPADVVRVWESLPKVVA